MFGIAGSHLGGSAVALGKVCVLHAQVYFPNSASLFDNWIARNPVINPHVLIEIDILDMPYLLGNSIFGPYQLELAIGHMLMMFSGAS